MQATLVDLNGRTMQEEIFSTNANAGSYKLSLKNKPAPGMYFLQIKAEGLLLKTKVVVQ